jgi:hypothetical protein
LTGGKERSRLTGENAEIKGSLLAGKGLKSVVVVDVTEECI